MEKTKHMHIKQSTHKKLHKIKLSEGGKNYPEIIEDLINREFERKKKLGKI